MAVCECTDVTIVEALRLLVEFLEPHEPDGVVVVKRDIPHLQKLVNHARKALQACAEPDSISETAAEKPAKELAKNGDAESADIGKLDSADKDENVLCAFCPMRSPDRTMKACLDAGKCLYADKPVGHFALAQRQIPRNATELAAMAIRGEFNDAEKTGSAETGGEKACP